jgi:flagellar assembly protein FliH
MVPTVIREARVALERRMLEREREAPAPAPLAPVRAAASPLREPDPVAMAAERQLDIERAIAEHEQGTAVAIEQAREAARAEGRAQGLAEGRDEGRAQAVEEAQAAAREHSTRIDAFLAKLESTRESALVANEADALAIGFAAACKVLGERLVTAEGVQGAVREVLDRIRATEKLVLRLSPRDYEWWKSLDTEGAFAGRAVDLIADSSLAFGGCVVETGAGTLEARMEEQVAGLKDVLLKAHGAPPSDGESA